MLGCEEERLSQILPAFQYYIIPHDATETDILDVAERVKRELRKRSSDDKTGREGVVVVKDPDEERIDDYHLRSDGGDARHISYLLLLSGTLSTT